MAGAETPQGWLCVPSRAGGTAWVTPEPPKGALQGQGSAPLTPPESRHQIFTCSRSQWQSSPKEPLEILISLSALTFHLKHGSELCCSKEPTARPKLHTTWNYQGFFQQLTPQLITFKSNSKIKFPCCFYQKSPTWNVLCQPKQSEHSEPRVRDTLKAENELSANNSCLAYLSISSPKSWLFLCRFVNNPSR